MQITGKNTIGFRLSQKGKYSFKTFDPVLDQPNPESYFEATEEEVEMAVAMAVKSFSEFARLTGEKRAVFLLQIAANLNRDRDQIIHQYTLESGLTASRGTIELNRTIFQLETFAAFIGQDNWEVMAEESALPNRKPTPKPHFKKLLFPLGPVVVFGASNFPFAYSTIGGDAASALAAGCPVIVKSHPMHAGTGDLVSQAIMEAARYTGMPDGIFSNLNAKGFEVGELLVKHPGVKAVGFTGSVGGGMALVKYAQEREVPIPVFCEMGSLNPIFVLPSALPDQLSIAEKLVNSITQDSGQFCTKPGMIFLADDQNTHTFIGDFTRQFKAKVPQSMLHPDIWSKYNILRFEVGNQQGTCAVTPSINEVERPNFGLPQLTFTTSEVFFKNQKLYKEVFGPHCLVVLCKSENEFAQIANFIEGQLTASIWSNDTTTENFKDLLFELQNKVGRIILNGVSTGVEVTEAMHHGGQFPSSTDSRFTAVGKDAIYRFLHPVSLQGFG